MRIKPFVGRAMMVGLLAPVILLMVAISPVSADVMDITGQEDPAGQDDFDLTDFIFLPPGGGHIDQSDPLGHAFETANNFGDYHLLITVIFDTPPTQATVINIDKDVINNTSVHWDDFHIHIEPSTPSLPPPMFLPGIMDTSGPGVGFDDITIMGDTVWFEGGPGVAPGEVWKGWLGIEIPPFPGVVYTFLMWQEPSIVGTAPEPSTITLAALGLLSLGMTRRRRRR